MRAKSARSPRRATSPLRFGAFCLLLLLPAACASPTPPYALSAPPPAAIPPGAPPPTAQFHQVGLASWYGGKFHGRRTASGEVFDQNGPTAAHRTLPFGTHVRVINLENGRATVLRITDRGPFVRGRIIDVSRRAAEVLGFRNQGVTRVGIQIVQLGG